MDVVGCKTLSDKLRWAYLLVDQERTGALEYGKLKTLIPLLDQVRYICFRGVKRKL